MNGEPCCANKRLLADILRKEWDFKGYGQGVETYGGVGITGDTYARRHLVSPPA